LESEETEMTNERIDPPQSTSANDMDGILRRVQKLLAIANDHRADPNEAAAAASQAERIMRKYQLDNAALIAHDLRTKSGGIVRNYAFANMKRDEPGRTPLKRLPNWADRLGVALARLNDCEVRKGFAPRPSNPSISDIAMVFYGFSADVQVAVWMYDYLVGSLISEMKQYQKGRTLDKVTSHAYREGYMNAVISRIYEMIEGKQGELLENLTPTGDASRDLVLLKHSKIEEAFGKFNYTPVKGGEINDYDAYMNGRKKGEAVDIARRALEGQQGGDVRRLR
jgi:hypothetical protein